MMQLKHNSHEIDQRITKLRRKFKIWTELGGAHNFSFTLIMAPK
jgi:hypothetical protein